MICCRRDYLTTGTGFIALLLLPFWIPELCQGVRPGGRFKPEWQFPLLQDCIVYFSTILETWSTKDPHKKRSEHRCVSKLHQISHLHIPQHEGEGSRWPSHARRPPVPPDYESKIKGRSIENIFWGWCWGRRFFLALSKLPSIKQCQSLSTYTMEIHIRPFQIQRSRTLNTHIYGIMETWRLMRQKEIVSRLATMWHRAATLPVYEYLATPVSALSGGTNKDAERSSGAMRFTTTGQIEAISQVQTDTATPV